jgi:serine/threonine-protein kinase
MAEGFRERFEAEIESLKKLQHEGIVRLLGYGEHEGILFYSMELVEGQSLEQEINGGRRFDWNETLTLAVQVCRALKHAHDHGVVHRDIKPANLLLTSEGRVKIADFGIARLFGSTQLTTAGGVLGTADYMSPEQADGRAVTEKCDQYSLGCVMYALLAGRPPFRAKSMPEMLQLQRFAQPEPVRRFAPKTPDELERLIGQLLSKEPAERFPNVLVLSRHMEAMQKGLSRPPKADPRAEAREVVLADTRLDSTAVFNADATLAPEDLSILPSETTDSGVYDAPTLADEGQLQLEDSPVQRPAVGNAVTNETPTTAVPRTSRFTTVDEDLQRQQREQATQRWVLGLQLLGLLTALGVVGWLGWRMSQPATADDLYREIAEHLNNEGGGDDLGPVESEIKAFLKRFPQDARANEVSQLSDELVLQRRERQLRKGLLPGAGETHPVASIFGEAIRIREYDPARAAEMLEDLLALYPADGEAAAKLSESQRTNLALAKRELSLLRERLADQAAQQLPELKQRLTAARQLEQSNPEQSAAMYQALVDLYAGHAWAAAAVTEARERLQVLAER